MLSTLASTTGWSTLLLTKAIASLLDLIPKTNSVVKVTCVLLSSDFGYLPRRLYWHWKETLVP